MNKGIIFLTGIIFFTISLKAETMVQSDISIIRERIVNELLKSELDDSQIANLIETIKEDGNWPGINYENVFRTNYEHSKHINNLVTLSKGYKNPSSSFYKSKKLPWMQAGYYDGMHIA